ncbi:unnamed protein product [Lota lota]
MAYPHSRLKVMNQGLEPRPCWPWPTCPRGSLVVIWYPPDDQRSPEAQGFIPLFPAGILRRSSDSTMPASCPPTTGLPLWL